MKFNCLNCGDIDEAIFDGYPFGDRLLEGIKFVAKKNDDGTCEVRPQNDIYFHYLGEINMKYWLGCAKTFAEQNDIFECPKCGEDVIPQDMM